LNPDSDSFGQETDKNSLKAAYYFQQTFTFPPHGQETATNSTLDDVSVIPITSPHALLDNHDGFIFIIKLKLHYYMGFLIQVASTNINHDAPSNCMGNILGFEFSTPMLSLNRHGNFPELSWNFEE
jgi:hypothetical protein